MHRKIFLSTKNVCKKVLNTFESLGTPKTPKKIKKGIFRDLKIGAGVLKVALKYFQLAFGPKNFRWTLPYLYAGKVSDFGHS